MIQVQQELLYMLNHYNMFLSQTKMELLKIIKFFLEQAMILERLKELKIITISNLHYAIYEEK